MFARVKRKYQVWPPPTSPEHSPTPEPTADAASRITVARRRTWRSAQWWWRLNASITRSTAASRRSSQRPATGSRWHARSARCAATSTWKRSSCSRCCATSLERELDAGTGTGLALCRQLAVRLLHHNLKEEKILYPRADDALPPAAAARQRAFLGSGDLPEGWMCMLKARSALQSPDRAGR